jgi:hypothetical protein
MLLLEVNGQFIAWPEEFAILMMKYYRKHGVNYILHRNCGHTGWDTTAENVRAANSTVPFGAIECSS